MEILKFSEINKNYNTNGNAFTALKDINITISSGELIGLSGKSGSGKTTLLNLAGLIDSPSNGLIYFKNKNTSSLSDDQLSYIRRNEIGFIFQNFNLMPLLTTLENVEYPLLIQGLSEKMANERAMDAIAKVGLEKQIHNNPSQLSGGQRQRVAIARAIVKNPALILADEPTANLDSKTSEEVVELILKLHNELKVTVIICSHDNELISQTKRIIRIQDGRMI